MHFICISIFSTLPEPCINGDYHSIKNSQDDYVKGVEGCKNNLNGKLILSKGATPYG